MILENPFPDGLGVRIPGFHPGGPGSIPGLGVFFELAIIFAKICREKSDLSEE